MGVECTAEYALNRDRRLASAWLLQRSGKQVEAVVNGDSMHPTLPAGARVLIDCTPTELLPGDIVCFVAGEKLICHRLLYGGRFRRAKEYVITRGDGTWLCDPPAARNTVLGVVIKQLSADAEQTVATAPQYGVFRRIAYSTLQSFAILLLETSVRLAQVTFIALNRVLSRKSLGRR